MTRIESESTGAAASQMRRNGNPGVSFFDGAVLAARSGRHTDALGLLAQAEEQQEQAPAKILDLRARIYAQQGMYTDAEKCWREALAIDSGNPEYEQGIARLRSGGRSLPSPAAVMGILLGIAVISMLVWQSAVLIPRLQDRLDSAESAILALHAEVVEMEVRGEARNEALALSVAAVEHGTIALGEVTAGLAPRFDAAIRDAVGPLREVVELMATTSQVDSVTAALSALDLRVGEALEQMSDGARGGAASVHDMQGPGR